MPAAAKERSTTDKAERKAAKAQKNPVVTRGARVGLLGRGLLWGVLGIIALRLAAGQGGQADRKGALRGVADAPLGEPLLLVCALGFAAYATWRFLEAVGGHKDCDGLKRWGKRVSSLGKAGLYAFFAVTTTTFLLGFNRSGRQDPEPWTARVMAAPGGRYLVGLVGLGLVGGGIYIAVRGARTKHMDKLHYCGRFESAVQAVGVIGLVGRGTVVAMVGWFLVDAAIDARPQDARGLDEALHDLAGTSHGPMLLRVAAAAILCFAVWSFAEARWRKT